MSYPKEFLDRMKNELKDEFDLFLSALEMPAPVSVRLNPFKQTEFFYDSEIIPWCENGRYLSERPSFTLDPLFHAGCYYVQEASSMSIEHVIKENVSAAGPVVALDMCAAPGGKSTHLLSLLPADSLLVSNEVIPSRNNILRQNIAKWGSHSCIVTQSKAEDFSSLKGFFDLVLVDAPCSGEGLFRKDPDAMEEWNLMAVSKCSQRQSEILHHAGELLSEGGLLIYSTCTWEREENEEQVKILIERGGYELIQLKKNDEGIVQSEFGLRFYPHKVKGEGFFLSALRKTRGVRMIASKKKSAYAEQNQKAIIAKYLEGPELFQPFEKNGLVYAIPAKIYPEFNLIKDKLYIRHAGVPLGEIKGKDFIPSYELALCTHISDKTHFKDLSLDESLEYLRGKWPGVKLEDRSWSLIKYKGFALGWAREVGGRVNNYYPKECRIKMM
ncbi:MAG: RNA methyltransferase [Bacteroidetes bacterium]|nr:MAG: RNA methyltransferase [Bacteroidota bacterium]REK07595.1 MAG: RNA methyltransferase [Bacteroidota bacterium]REK36973.1 MAG: RNA methyltransferase [Bacteroidota bacterium]REK47793.1 MAG: RNA methyltransferase [Bacteroidota bacterium]